MNFNSQGYGKNISFDLILKKKVTLNEIILRTNIYSSVESTFRLVLPWTLDNIPFITTRRTVLLISPPIYSVFSDHIDLQKLYVLYDMLERV